jgi:hypothetical protein
MKFSKILLIILVFSLALLFYLGPNFLSKHYFANQNNAAVNTYKEEKPVIVFKPSYIETPEAVKGIYMTSWVAGTPNLRNKLVKIIDETEINSVVIDIKDYSGKIVFPVESEELKKYGSQEVRIPDLKEFIESLHKKNIYVIGRLAVFQDAYFVKHRPDLAVKNKSGEKVWKDRKGISWIDPGSNEYWDYIIILSNESRKVGFDEINYDYIRFPSDGDMNDISYPFSSSTPKAKVLKNFFQYLRGGISDNKLKISADLFGMVTTERSDMGIGQILENALPYFDYISPMVYPSHYPPNFQGYSEPESHPYEVVKYAMTTAVSRANIASSSPSKLRPWLQDFGLRVTYGPEDVKSQIKATYDSGLNSWLLWSAANKYNVGALEKN